MSVNSEADPALQHDWTKIAASAQRVYELNEGEDAIAFEAAVRHAVNLYNWFPADFDVEKLKELEENWKGWKPE